MDKHGSETRTTWDQYFIGIMKSAAKRATCDRGRSGAIITKDNSVVSTGYVGSPRGFPHCDDVGHKFKKVFHEDGSVSKHCVRTVHAEMNAICQAAMYGRSTDGGTMYCMMIPCEICAKLIINCGIKEVIAAYSYQSGKESIEMFKEAKIKFRLLSEEKLY